MRKVQLQLSLPNSLTLARVVLSPVFYFLILSESSTQKQISLVVFLVAALTDWYDGWIARKYGEISRWGKFLDPLADKILSSFALLAYVSLGLVDGWMVWIVIVRDFLMTGLRSYAEYLDRPIVTSKTAQAKTFGQFVVIYYILLLYVGREIQSIDAEFGPTIESLMDYRVLFGMMLLVTLSTVGTLVVYLFDNRKFLREIYGSLRARL